jgi:hypothetical protein
MSMLLSTLIPLRKAEASPVRDRTAAEVYEFNDISNGTDELWGVIWRVAVPHQQTAGVLKERDIHGYGRENLSRLLNEQIFLNRRQKQR